MSDTDIVTTTTTTATKKNKKTVNESLFRPSEFDDYPLKRDDKHTNKIVQPDFAPFSDVNKQEKLPEGFSFVSIDIRDDAQLKKMCVFLNANHKNASLPFTFDAKHIKWLYDIPALNFPRAEAVISGCIISVQAADKMVGLIASRPITYRVDGRVICSLEVGLLTTLVDFRGKRLAAVMMRELYRRAYVWGVSVGMIFTLPRQLPALFTVGPIKMLKRTIVAGDETLQPNKNIDLVRFANLRDLSRMMKIYRTYTTDQASVGARLHREYNRREFEHTFLDRTNVMTYIIRTEKGIKDFASLYSVTEHGTNNQVAFIHFISFVNDKLLELFMQNLLFIISKNKFSAVYIADIAGVGPTLTQKLGFQETTEIGWMYQFNYNTTTIDSSQCQISPPM